MVSAVEPESNGSMTLSELYESNGWTVRELDSLLPAASGMYYRCTNGPKHRSQQKNYTPKGSRKRLFQDIERVDIDAV